MALPAGGKIPRTAEKVCGRPEILGLEFSSSNHVQIENKVYQRDAGIKHYMFSQ